VTATTEDSVSGDQRPRGWISLYGLAFVLMLAAGAALAIAGRGFLRDRSLLWLSVALSATSIVSAVVGLVLPRRR
jgi:hypothetical protein